MLAIFVPGQRMATQETLREIGCGPLLDKTVAAMKVDATVEGPNVDQGSLFYVEQPGSPRKPIVSVDIKLQTWSEAARSNDLERGRYWLGYWTDNPPQPEDLQRDRLCDGQLVELADGRQWAIPVADYLPTRLTIDPETGAELEVVAKRFEQFTRKANQLFEHFLSDDLVKIIDSELIVHVPDGLSFAAEALAINYRVNRDLIDMIGLVGKYEAFGIAEVVTGIRMSREASQKKTLLSTLCEA